jgi:uncharacterized protein (TIGR03067 family)
MYDRCGLKEAAGSAGRVQLTFISVDGRSGHDLVQPDCGPQAMHGGIMTRTLTPRPNLEHFRGQAKALLAELRAGDTAAAQAFADHLPKARGLSVAKVRSAGFKLADAQSTVARRNGFASWPALVRHVDLLRALEGEWSFDALQVDGDDMPRALISASKLLLDGDRFRMESPEANYDGRFGIDTSMMPMHIDIQFVEGPDAGNSAHGIFELNGDALTICLGLVGSSRPTAFVTKPGTGHALERLRRTSSLRPAGVTGGVAAQSDVAPPASPAVVDPADFESAASPMLQRLQGSWVPTRLVTNGDEMRADWLPFGSRVGTGNEVKVVFGGQIMLHVKTRIDDSVLPIVVDYLHLHGADKGKTSLGIMEWLGEEVRFLMAAPGYPRPTTFSDPGAACTLSQWKRTP